MYFFDGWRVHPTLPIPSNPPRTKEAPVRDITHATSSASAEPTRTEEEEEVRHPCDSRQESGGRCAKHKAGSCPRMQVLKGQYGSIMQEVHKSGPHPHTAEQRSGNQPRIIAHKEDSSQ